jgi:hypothetical protein
MQKMFEAGIRDERRLCPLAFQQRVRGYGRAVCEAVDAPCAGGSRSSEHRLLLSIRGQHLARRDVPVLEQHRVGEGAADVDAENRHSGVRRRR